MKTLLTKKAINTFVKSKDTKAIIKLYQLESERNPLREYNLKMYYDNLNGRQKDRAVELLDKGYSFGLSEKLLWQLKELLGMMRIIWCADETRKIVNPKTQKYVCEYPV